MEFRAAAKLELRAGGDGKLPTIVGHVHSYGSRATVGDPGMFTEEFLPGAFRESLSGDYDVPATVEHDPARVVGLRSANMAMHEDDSGVRVEVDPPDTTEGRDLVSNIRAGIVKGMSFGFRNAHDLWTPADPSVGRDLPHRSVSKADMREVTFTHCPVYEDTAAALRSLAVCGEDPAGTLALRVRLAEVSE